MKTDRDARCPLFEYAKWPFCQRRNSKQARSLAQWPEGQLHEYQVSAEPIRAFVVGPYRCESERPVQRLGLSLKIAGVDRMVVKPTPPRS